MGDDFVVHIIKSPKFRARRRNSPPVGWVGRESTLRAYSTIDETSIKLADNEVRSVCVVVESFERGEH